MEPIEKLVEIEKIKQLKARYFRFIDTRNWAAWQELFAPDATLDTGSRSAGIDRMTGPAAIVAGVRSAIDGATTVHHGHMPEIEILTPVTACGVWAMEDLLEWRGGLKAPLVLRAVQGYGHYHETYVKQGDDWKFQSITLTRLRVIEHRATGP